MASSPLMIGSKLLPIILCLVVIGVPLFTISALTTHSSAELPDVTLFQAIGFLLLSLFEAVSLALGVLFLIVIIPIIRTLNVPFQKQLRWMSGALSWLLIQWWPHDYAHLHNNGSAGMLLLIEYVFHFTSIIAAGVLAYGFVSMLRKLVASK